MCVSSEPKFLSWRSNGVPIHDETFGSFPDLAPSVISEKRLLMPSSPHSTGLAEAFWLPGRIAGSYTRRAGPGNKVRNQLHARDFHPVPFPGNVQIFYEDHDTLTHNLRQ